MWLLMEWYLIFLIVWFGLTIVPVGYGICNCIRIIVLNLKNANQKCFCDHCRVSYIEDYEMDYLYCPFCGRELTDLN